MVKNDIRTSTHLQQITVPAQLQHIAAYYSTLQQIAAHCSTLQYIAVHWSTLQHIAAHSALYFTPLEP